MPDKQHHTPTGELSYYGLSLLSYLKDSHPELIAESEFIAERADSAAQAYSEAIRSGCNHIEAEEIAREELCRGLHFSPYNTLVNILWREFEAEIPEDTARQAALRLLPLCRGVLRRHARLRTVLYRTDGNRPNTSRRWHSIRKPTSARISTR